MSIDRTGKCIVQTAYMHDYTGQQSSLRIGCWNQYRVMLRRLDYQKYLSFVECTVETYVGSTPLRSCQQVKLNGSM